MNPRTIPFGHHNIVLIVLVLFFIFPFNGAADELKSSSEPASKPKTPPIENHQSKSAEGLKVQTNEDVPNEAIAKKNLNKENPTNDNPNSQSSSNTSERQLTTQQSDGMVSPNEKASEPSQYNETQDANTKQGQEKKRKSPGPKSVVLTPMFQGYFWNLELEGALLPVHSDGEFSIWSSRIRAGILKTRDPWFASLDLGFDVGGLEKMALGFHGVITHYNSGFWAHALFNLSFEGQPIIGAAAGWSIFGIEGQLAPSSNESKGALLLKVRIPIGTIVYAQRKM